MSAPKRVLILVGSPRGAKSCSESLGNYLSDRFAERGVETERVRIGGGLPSAEKLAEIVSSVERADLIVLAAPLYVDSQPAPVVRVMEYIAERRGDSSVAGAPRFSVVLNCGLPDTYNNDVALRIYRRFAAEAGMQWMGGLALGMGEALEQKPLDQTGRMGRQVRKSLDLAAAALADGKRIPDQAVRLMGKLMMPRWLYTFVAHRSWRRRLRKHGGRPPLDARPYQP